MSLVPPETETEDYGFVQFVARLSVAWVSSEATQQMIMREIKKWFDKYADSKMLSLWSYRLNRTFTQLYEG